MVRVSDHTGLARGVSLLLGSIYTLAWSASFYPQPISNWRRKSIEGLSFDFNICNLLGFLSYTIYVASLLYSPTIRFQYAQRHENSQVPAVRFNDLLYSVHGLIMILVVFSQFWPQVWGFKVAASQKASRRMIGICVAGLSVPFLLFLFATFGDDKMRTQWQYLDVLYAVGNLKIYLTIIKYLPQMYLNYRRKSTVGWSIEAIMLDFVGGCLSIIQLLIDVSLSPDWSGLTGNPAKLALGNVTLFFDLVFFAQHFVLYRGHLEDNGGGSRGDASSEEEAALLDRRAGSLRAS